MKTVAFVPIRLNSRRVEGKNLRLLGGRPLMTYILDTLRDCERIDETYVYCSDPDIARHLPDGVKFLRRDPALDSDSTLGEEIYDAFTREVDADIYVLAHATSPFIRRATVDDAVARVGCGEYDSAFSASKPSRGTRVAPSTIRPSGCRARRIWNPSSLRLRHSSCSAARCGATCAAA